eukprot:6208608-Pleurochrysis_carterae.AAC.1
MPAAATFPERQWNGQYANLLCCRYFKRGERTRFLLEALNYLYALWSYRMHNALRGSDLKSRIRTELVGICYARDRGAQRKELNIAFKRILPAPRGADGVLHWVPGSSNQDMKLTMPLRRQTCIYVFIGQEMRCQYVAEQQFLFARIYQSWMAVCVLLIMFLDLIIVRRARYAVYISQGCKNLRDRAHW